VNIHNRLVYIFDRNWIRWSLIVIFLGLMFRIFFETPHSEYSFERAEDVKIISIRPIKSVFGGDRVYVTFAFLDGRVATTSLPNLDSLKADRYIRIDVLTSPKKKNRYRLAQDSIQP